jgi:VWFA-related protein
MRIRYWLLKLLAMAIATSAIAFATAQEPQKQLPENPADSVIDEQSESTNNIEGDSVCTFILIIFNVSVTDSNHQPITDLEREDFAVAEDGAKQDIESFARRDSPVDFGLVFHLADDEPLRLMARQVVQSFARQIRSTDEITIPQIKAGHETVRALTTDKRRIEDALSKISSNNGTPLFDVIAERIKGQQEKGREQRRITVVITDGLSLFGAASDKDAAYAILRQGEPIYLIMLEDGRYSSRLAIQSRARRTTDLLTRLAEVSGGFALVVKSEDEISAATEQFINRLKNQYTLAYSPKNEKSDGAFRHISVTVTPKDKRKVKVFAPLGYYAIDPAKIREGKINGKSRIVEDSRLPK